MSVYAVENLSVSIGGRTLVESISFAIEAGECLALVGESGSGKSLTALSPFGLGVGQASGSIRLAGAELRGLDETALRPIRAHETGFVFQQPLTALTPHLTIGRQLVEAATQAGAPRPKRNELAAMLARVGLEEADAKLDRYPHQLSGGQRQRALIAMAIAHRPRLLIADEPTSALDAALRGGIMDLLDELRRETGMAMLLVSHDLGEVRAHADHLVVLREGGVVEAVWQLPCWNIRPPTIHAPLSLRGPVWTVPRRLSLRPVNCSLRRRRSVCAFPVAAGVEAKRSRSTRQACPYERAKGLPLLAPQVRANPLWPAPLCGWGLATLATCDGKVNSGLSVRI